MTDQLKTIAAKLADASVSRCKTTEDHERLLAEIERHYWHEIASRALTTAEPDATEIRVSRAAKREAVLSLLNDDAYRTAPGKDVAKVAGVSESMVSTIRRQMKATV